MLSVALVYVSRVLICTAFTASRRVYHGNAAFTSWLAGDAFLRFGNKKL
ncbi:MAG: hypothetical protein ACLSWY_03190 [Ruthenibacterium lactatiformans]